MQHRKKQYESDGYLVLPGFCPAADCDGLIERAARLSKDFDYSGHASIFQTREQAASSDDYFMKSGDNISFFFEKDAFDSNGTLKQPVELSFNKIGHALHDLDPVFDKFSRSQALQELATELDMKDHVLMQSMYIFKHAKIGGIVDVHQDGSFLYTEPQTCTGFWFALEDATVENGCLWAKPGGHLTTLRQRFERTDDCGTKMETLDSMPISTDDMLPLEVEKGTCIVLHGLLPHFSLPNTSGRSRQAYAIHSVDRHAIYPASNWLQRKELKLRGFSE